MLNIFVFLSSFCNTGVSLLWHGQYFRSCDISTVTSVITVYVCISYHFMKQKELRCSFGFKIYMFFLYMHERHEQKYASKYFVCLSLCKRSLLVWIYSKVPLGPTHGSVPCVYSHSQRMMMIAKLIKKEGHSHWFI